MERSTVERIGDVEQMVTSFRRHLRAENKAEQTITAYTYAPLQLAEFLTDKGMPTDVGSIPGACRILPRGSAHPTQRCDGEQSLPGARRVLYLAPRRGWDPFLPDGPHEASRDPATARPCPLDRRHPDDPQGGSDHVGDHIKAWGEVA